MTSPSKAKGNGYERELVEQAKAAGLPARRAWGSNGAAMGLHPEVDIELKPGVTLQAKRRKALPAYLQIPDSCTGVAFRQDRGKPMVLVRLADFLAWVGSGFQKEQK